jgi:hypothetical protein
MSHRQGPRAGWFQGNVHKKDRNRPGGNANDMLLFNDIIQHLELVEIPLKDRAYTRSNMQYSSLLEKLDWVFTCSNWTLTFPNTVAYALANIISDHVPYGVQMESDVPKFNIFRFENLWVSHLEFTSTVEHLWALPVHRDNAALTISSIARTNYYSKNKVRR